MLDPSSSPSANIAVRNFLSTDVTGERVHILPGFQTEPLPQTSASSLISSRSNHDYGNSALLPDREPLALLFTEIKLGYCGGFPISHSLA
jgi:hypothetical protein